MNVLFKMKKPQWHWYHRAKQTQLLGKEALPGASLLFKSLTSVPLSNYCKVYFYFYTPRLRKHVSLKGFSYTISEMAFQKSKFQIVWHAKYTSRLANKHASGYPWLHVTSFCPLYLHLVVLPPIPLIQNSRLHHLIGLRLSFLNSLFANLGWDEAIVGPNVGTWHGAELGRVCCHTVACKQSSTNMPTSESVRWFEIILLCLSKRKSQTADLMVVIKPCY